MKHKRYFIVCIIKSRLTGKAGLKLEINCRNTTWAGLKQILINNLSVKKNLYQLIDEVRLCTVIDFYNNI